MLANLRGSREYLNQIADEWVNGREVARTPVGAARTTTLTLQDRRSATTFDASFPDVSGEAFMEAWAGRELQPEVHALLATAHGLLLFVHAADVTPPTRIDEWRTVFGDALGDAGDDATLTDAPNAMADDAGAGGDGTPTHASGASGALVGAALDADDEVHAYDATKAPTDTILVDLLQAFGDLARERTPVPVALVVSAWDLVQRTTRGASAPTPAAWVAAQLPLMTQFLEANARTFATRIYGVSAQGGDVRDAADVARLLGMLDPEERIVVVGPAGTSGQPMSPHDLSAPVRWALLGEEGA